MVNDRRAGPLACILVFLLSGPALAWSDVGHRIICEIAFQELVPTARERVKALIRRDREFDTFAEACRWPDHPRRRAEEHYVNLPRDAEGLEADPCPLATVTMRTTTASPASRGWITPCRPIPVKPTPTRWPGTSAGPADRSDPGMLRCRAGE